MPQNKVLSKPFHLKDLVLEVERMFEIGQPSLCNGLKAPGGARGRASRGFPSGLLPMVRAYSSVVEHYVDIVGVASSILATPTIFPKHLARFIAVLLVHLNK